MSEHQEVTFTFNSALVGSNYHTLKNFNRDTTDLLSTFVDIDGIVTDGTVISRYGVHVVFVPEATDIPTIAAHVRKVFSAAAASTRDNFFPYLKGNDKELVITQDS